jgi:hypothetical protein
VVENLANNTSVYRKNKVIKTVESKVSERYSSIYLYVYIKDKTKRKKMNRNKKKVKKWTYKKKIAKKVNQKNQTRKEKYQGIYKKYECPWKMRKESRNTQKKCVVTKRIKMVSRHKKSMKKSQSEKNKREDIVNNTGARKHTWCTESTLGKCTDSTLGKCTAQGIATRNSVREGAWPMCIRIYVGKNVIRKYLAKNRVRKNKCLKNVVLIEISKMSNEPMEVPEAGGGDGVKGDGGKGNMYILLKLYMCVYAYECTNNKYHGEPSMVGQGSIAKWYKIGNSTQRVCNWYRRHGE